MCTNCHTKRYCSILWLPQACQRVTTLLLKCRSVATVDCERVNSRPSGLARQGRNRILARNYLRAHPCRLGCCDADALVLEFATSAAKPTTFAAHSHALHGRGRGGNREISCALCGPTPYGGSEWTHSLSRNLVGATGFEPAARPWTPSDAAGKRPERTNHAAITLRSPRGAWRVHTLHSGIGAHCAWLLLDGRAPPCTAARPDLPRAAGSLVHVPRLVLPESAGLGRGVAPMADGTQDLAFCEFGREVHATAGVRDRRHVINLVSHMIEVEHNWIAFAAHSAAVLA